MFFSSNLKEISIPHFSASNSWEMRNLFNVSSLEKLNINERTSSPNTQYLGSVFKDTNSLKTKLDLSWLTSSEATMMFDMFSGIRNRTSTELNGWSEIDLSNMEYPATMGLAPITDNLFGDERLVFRLSSDFTEGNAGATPIIPYLTPENSSKYISCGGDDYITLGETTYPCFNQCSFNNGLEDITAQEGEVVPMSCPDGYDLSSPVENITCNFGGFDRDDIRCIPKTCSQNIAFGDNITKDFAAGAAVVTCDEGYSPNVSQVTCQADGNFDYEVACIKDGATFTESYASNEVFKCNLDNDDSSDDINVVFTDDSFVQVVGGFGANPVDLPTESEGSAEIDYYIDWGDGECTYIEHDVSPDLLSHIYAEASDKTIRITGVVDNWGDVDGNPNYYPYLKSVTNLGDVGWSDLSFAFRNYRHPTR